MIVAYGNTAQQLTMYAILANITQFAGGHRVHKTMTASHDVQQRRMLAYVTHCLNITIDGNKQ